jgi:hypothetical protein
MQVRQTTLHHGCFSPALLDPLRDIDPMLVLVFADKRYLLDAEVVQALMAAFPAAIRVGASTAGEISSRGVEEESCVVTAVRFDRGQVRLATADVGTVGDSWQAGVAVGQQLPAAGLKSVLLFAPGRTVNGCELVAGLGSVVGEEPDIAGGLSCDNGGAITQALIMSPDGISDRCVVAVGLYGENLVVDRCSYGGWSPFGPPRRVTACDGNVLLGLDGEPALDVYGRYLGEYAKELPTAGLRFPFEVRAPDATHNLSGAWPGVIRAVLDVDWQRKGLVLGGGVELNSTARLMHVTASKLVGGARQAAERLRRSAPEQCAGLGMLVSCVGRKIIMADQIADELEAVHDTLGRHHTIAGFYAHGEFGPLGTTRTCRLHNQTMTIALITEPV